MKASVPFVTATLLLFVMAVDADCIKDQYGNVVCGKGQCSANLYGKIFCAANGGGALQDETGKVQCGVGYCAKDDLGKIWCSKEPGGSAAVDSYGKVKCVSGCEPAMESRCQEAQ